MSLSYRKLSTIARSAKCFQSFLLTRNNNLCNVLKQDSRMNFGTKVGVRDISYKRYLSSTNKTASNDEEELKTNATTVEDTSSEGTNDSLPDNEVPSPEEEFLTQISDLKDQLLRSLADQENTRRIAKRDVSNARSFAVTSFAKSLLDTSDNLTRAMEAVPVELRNDSENHPVLSNLYEGIGMTDDGLTKAFTKNGLSKFGAVGDKFDPNMHEALFEYADPDKKAGTIGQVMKLGFTLNDRVIRPSEVGIVK